MLESQPMAPNGLSNRDFWVGEWRVEPHLSTIQRGDETVHVTPRAMAVLVYLADAAGNVVSRNAILDAVWPRMVVSQDALTQCLVELRKAFGDSPKTPQVLQTIPKVGVRLMAPVANTPPAEPVTAAPGSIGASPENAGADHAPNTAGPAEQHYRRRPAFNSVRAAMIALFVVAASFGAAAWVVGRGHGADSPVPRVDRRTIAALPFAADSVGDDRAQFIADGLHDELLGRLERIGTLSKVISRTSVMAYRDTKKSIREIGHELGVATILETRLQRIGDALRINTELVDTETEQMIWSETYARSLTAENIFAVQSELAIAIARTLEAALTETDLARLRNVPTRDAAARDFYLSGVEYARRTNRADALPHAERLFSQATEADPGFALAWVHLGSTHTGMYWYNLDHTPARLALAEQSIRHAFQLEPDLPEAHVAMADFLYHGSNDFEHALAELSLAERSIPQSADLRFFRGSIYRRIGNWQRATEDFAKAVELDPRNTVYLRQQHITYEFMRDYANAGHSLDRLLAVTPDDATAYVDKVILALCKDGDTALARRFADAPPTPSYAQGLAHTYTVWLAAIFDRDYPRARAILDATSEESIFDGDLRNSYSPKAMFYARTYWLAGDRDRARDYYRTAAHEVSAQLQAASKKDAIVTAYERIALAETAAALGEPAAALESARQAANLLPKKTDAIAGSGLQIAAVIRVLVLAGDMDEAVRELDDYLSGPGHWSTEGLLADPRIDPIRNDPRFMAVVARHRRG
ncbi:MAG: winged helix-turn-helix domain-containing protein [Gammaproteobacteria bacterium]